VIVPALDTPAPPAPPTPKKARTPLPPLIVPVAWLMSDPIVALWAFDTPAPPAPPISPSPPLPPLIAPPLDRVVIVLVASVVESVAVF